MTDEYGFGLGHGSELPGLGGYPMPGGSVDHEIVQAAGDPAVGPG